MRYFAFKRPTDFKSSNCDNRRFLSELARLILAVKRIVFDWITSSVVLPSPVSYSTVIPSWAISAAFTCARTEDNKLSEDWNLDQALATFVSLVLTALSKSNCFRFCKFLLLSRDAEFFPPWNIGHEISALTVSCSLSSYDELKSSDFEDLAEIVAEGENSERAILTSFSDWSYSSLAIVRSGLFPFEIWIAFWRDVGISNSIFTSSPKLSISSSGPIIFS